MYSTSACNNKTNLKIPLSPPTGRFQSYIRLRYWFSSDDTPTPPTRLSRHPIPHLPGPNIGPCPTRPLCEISRYIILRGSVHMSSASCQLWPCQSPSEHLCLLHSSICPKPATNTAIIYSDPSTLTSTITPDATYNISLDGQDRLTPGLHSAFHATPHEIIHSP